MGCDGHHRPSDLHPRDLNFILFALEGHLACLIMGCYPDRS